MFGRYGKALHKTCVTFVSKIAIENKTIEKYQLNKIILPVENCRNIGKKDLIHNDKTPNIIEVNPENYEVKVDGKKSPANLLKNCH